MEGLRKMDQGMTFITINSRRIIQKRPNPLQLKMLPSLKRIVQIEPINFINY